MQDFNFIYSPTMSREELNIKIKEFIELRSKPTQILVSIIKLAEDQRKRNSDANPSSNSIMPKF